MLSSSLRIFSASFRQSQAQRDFSGPRWLVLDTEGKGPKLDRTLEPCGELRNSTDHPTPPPWIWMYLPVGGDPAQQVPKYILFSVIS